MELERVIQQAELPQANLGESQVPEVIGLGSFAEKAREWAAEVKPVEVAREELFSFDLAAKLIDFAKDTKDAVVDVPLLPSIQIGARPTEEQISFGNSVLGEDCVPIIKKAFSRKDCEEFTVNLARSGNKELLKLVAEISETLNEFSVSVVAKRNRYGFAEFFVRLNSGQSQPEENVSRESHGFSTEIESRNEKMVADTRALLRKRHKQYEENPLSLEGKVLIDPSESPLLIDIAKQSYSRHKLNTFAVGVAAAGFLGQKIVLMMLGGQVRSLMIVGCTLFIYGLVALGSSGNRLMHRLFVPADKLNDINSSSIQGLLTEIRELGYKPMLFEHDDKLRLGVLFK